MEQTATEPISVWMFVSMAIALFTLYQLICSVIDRRDRQRRELDNQSSVVKSDISELEKVMKESFAQIKQSVSDEFHKMANDFSVRIGELDQGLREQVSNLKTEVALDRTRQDGTNKDLERQIKDSKREIQAVITESRTERKEQNTFIQTQLASIKQELCRKDTP